MKTVGDLKKAIKGLPDNAPILVRPQDGIEFQTEWRYNTREVANVYSANDDRYSQNRVVTIELGGFSD